MAVSEERLKVILANERDMDLQQWERYFDKLTEEEQAAYIAADSGQKR